MEKNQHNDIDNVPLKRGYNDIDNDNVRERVLKNIAEYRLGAKGVE